MKTRMISCAIALAAATMASSGQVQGILGEDFELYGDGNPLEVASGWTGDVTNQTAYVTNNGTSQVGEFTGTGWGVIGTYLQGYIVPAGVDSKLLSDYTIEFDVEKTEGTATSPEVEVHTSVGLVRMNYPDPAVGGGQVHVSLNLANNIYIDEGFTMYGQDSVDLVLKQFGGAEGVRQTYQIDNLVLSVDPSSFVKHACLPTGTIIGDTVELSATYEDNASQVESMTLYLDGSAVITSNNYAGATETNTISYVTSGLSLGNHTAKVVVVGSESISITNVWAFKLIADDPTIEVGSEDFESYTVGIWDSATYPDPNPALGGGAQSALIVDSGNTNGLELVIDGNLSNQWSTGIQFYMDLNGYNESTHVSDYTVSFRARFDDYTQDLGNMGFEMILWNPAVGAQGNSYQMGTVAPTELANMQAGEMWVTYTIPLDAADERPYSKTEVFDPSATQWQFQFAANNNLETNDKPVTFTIDDVFVSYTEPVFINPSYAPVGVTTNDPVLTATVLDGTSEVDTMVLYMDDAVVASNSFSGGSTTNTISYAAVGAAGGSHSAQVVYWDAGTNIATNVWSFIVPAPPIAPTTNAVALWNVNMAGCVNNGIRTVTNGLVLAAPTSGGSNLWNNAYGPDAPWSSPNMTLSAANEDNLDTVGIEFENSNWNDGPQSWAGYFDEFTALSNTIWGATQADNDNGIVRFAGVDTNETYDVYVYWTWNRNDDAKTFNVIEGICNLPMLTMAPDRAALIANPTNYVEGENYIVFTSIEPDESGNIAIQSSYSCAYQLVMRGEGGGPVGPTIDPTIKSFSVSGDMVHLYWDSENDVTYSVKSKSNLRGGAWVTVTNVPGAGATTSTTVPLSGDTEFFMIEGN